MLRRTRRPALILTSALPILLLAIGCEQAPPPKPRVKTRETIGKTTQDVRELKAELAKGAVLAETTIPEADPLTQNAAAYRTTVGKLGVMKVKMDMDMYEALNGEKPKTYEEFMEQIIKKGKAEGIQLPMLPYYQEYAYDTDKKELVVIEYPEKKKAFQEQTDRDMGRK